MALEKAGLRPREAGGSIKSRIAFQGRRDGRSAFALVNAQWSAGLERAGRYEVSDYDPDAIPPDLLIHHDFETHFSAFETPAGVRAAAVRTWDFGPLPTSWVGKINREFRQFWAYSRWTAGLAHVAGVDPQRIRVVPLGVDPGIFRPDGPTFPLPDGGAFRFLFVGGVSARKGTDILLEAYSRAFGSKDDVTLVLKDHSGDLFYKGDEVRGRISALVADPAAPRIVHIDRFLGLDELASLYRACDVAVFPYRAEGFCLPILEAMSCGTPPIVPEFGACLDFCSHEEAFLTPVRRIHLPVGGRFKVALGFEEEVEEVDFCEMDPDVLADRMREVFRGSSGERARRSAAGVRRARDGFTWSDSVARVVDCLNEMESRQGSDMISR